MNAGLCQNFNLIMRQNYACDDTLYSSIGVEQVMANLLTNAVKYSPQEGVVEVRLWVEKEASHALVSIKDSGIGIPVMQQARIFGRFVHAENGQALGIQGIGLGLYLSRGFVESHGGHLWFQSTEGVGSTFLVSFPTHRRSVG